MAAISGQERTYVLPLTSQAGQAFPTSSLANVLNLELGTPGQPQAVRIDTLYGSKMALPLSSVRELLPLPPPLAGLPDLPGITAGTGTSSIWPDTAY